MTWNAFLFCHRRRTVHSSQQTVPLGTGQNRKENAMRTSVTTLATVATVLMLAGSGASAQQAPVRTDAPFSPFTYERLGATPSIRLHRAAPPADSAQAEAKSQAALKSPGTVSAPEAARAAAARAQTAPTPAATPTTTRAN
jgi:hypothetical protein